MEFTSAQVTVFLGQYLWPFMRIGAMLIAAPVFGAKDIVPVRLRVGLAIVLTLAIAPTLPAVPAADPLSATGLLITFHQLLLGVAMGFVLQLVFSALVVGGQGIAMTMGLGFATFVDPQNGLQVPVLSSFYTILGTLLFLSMNGHIVALEVLAKSFQTMPIAPSGLGKAELLRLVLWGGQMFVGAVLIALPAMITLQLINLAFGIMTRAAPQLNIFAVGFPTTMAAGFVILFLTLPNLLPRFTDLVLRGFDLMQSLIARQ